MHNIALWSLLAFSTSLTTGESVPTPSPSPEPSPQTRSELASPPHRGIVGTLLHDEKEMWTSPAHISAGDLKWILPAGAITAALLATDDKTATWVSKDPHAINVSKDVSIAGAAYSTFGAAAALYLVGAATESSRAKTAGLMGLQALIDASVVVEVFKVSFGRDRPLDGNGTGQFFKNTHSGSFPSGHSIDIWSLATVIAGEYHEKKVVVFTAYTVATAVAASRVTAREHFPGDVFVGSLFGHLIGRYVVREHHPERKNSLILEPSIGPHGLGVVGSF